MTIDYTDSAALLALLRPAYYQLLAGSKTAEIDIPTAGGGTRRVKYAQTNLTALKEEILRLEALVATTSGASPKRFAIRAG
jgi:hypothetical protein